MPDAERVPPEGDEEDDPEVPEVVFKQSLFFSSYIIVEFLNSFSFDFIKSSQ